MYTFIGILAGIAAIGIAYGVYNFLRHRALLSSLRYILYRVKVPRTRPPVGGGKEADIKAEIGLTEQLVAALVGGDDHVAFEIGVHHVGEEIHFYLSVPRELGERAAKQVQGLWSGATVEPVAEDFNVFNPMGVASGAYLQLKEDFALPIRTYMEIGADTAAAILGGFAKMQAVGEGAALQLLVRPASKDAKNRLKGYLNALKKGEPLDKVIGHQNPFTLGELGHAMNPEKHEKEKMERIVDDDAVKALEAKASKQLFEVNLRLVTSAGAQRNADDGLEGIGAGFSQFGAPRRNEFKITKPRNMQSFLYDFVFRRFNRSQLMVLTSEEIASFWHLPISTTDTPRVKWLKSKEAPPPSNLVSEGTLIGQSVFRGEMKPVYIADEDRRRHVYAIGQTGSGKSTLLGNMIIEDIARGKGVVLIDPHGDLAENVLGHIPASRAQDVIYFDPADTARPLGLNMIEWNPARPEEKTFLVNEMQSIFNKLFPPETMGPMFEQYMRNALLLLMEDADSAIAGPGTLIEVPRIFTDPEYRKRKLARVQNPVLIDFWEREAAKAGGEASLANMTPYITSKFNNFVANDYMRPIIGQPKSAFNFRELMDNGKILIVNLSKGKIGDINAGLLE